MRKLARWHIWLGWIAAIPLLLWLVSGVFMALRPIDEVRGSHLRIEHNPEPVRVRLSAGGAESELLEGRLVNQRGRSILIATHLDRSVKRIDLQAEGHPRLPPVSAAEARAAVVRDIKGGADIQSVRLFDAGRAPLDFRKPMAAWQVTLADGTRIYVGRDTGEIEAVRTRFWRVYDLMWGLHIMNLSDREDPFRPVVLPLGILALVSCMFGAVLLFRRRIRPKGRTLKDRAR